MRPTTRPPLDHRRHLHRLPDAPRTAATPPGPHLDVDVVRLSDDAAAVMVRVEGFDLHHTEPLRGAMDTAWREQLPLVLDLRGTPPVAARDCVDQVARCAPEHGVEWCVVSRRGRTIAPLGASQVPASFASERDALQALLLGRLGFGPGWGALGS